MVNRHLIDGAVVDEDHPLPVALNVEGASEGDVLVVQADGTVAPKGRRTARVTTGSVSSAGEVAVTVTWDEPFPDANYTVAAQVVEDENGESLRVRRIRTVTADGCVVNVVNNALVSRTGTVHAIGIAD